MKVSSKLFLTLTGFTCFILLITILLARWSFSQGFLDFTKGMELQRLELIAQRLSNEYVVNGYGWQNTAKSGLDNFLRPPWSKRNRQKRPPLHPRHGASPPPTALFDKHGQWVAGLQSKVFISKFTQPIMVDDEIVGELRSWPDPFEHASLASSFSKQQLFMSILIGVLCLVISSIVAWFLTRRLLKPLRIIKSKIEALARGNYSKKPYPARNDELGELMKQLDSLSNTLDKTRDANKRLFADISHELRTPLTIIVGEIEALREGLCSFDSASLGSIDSEASRLCYLVNDLYHLSLSDIGGLKYQFSQHDIVKIMQRAIKNVTPQMDKKELTLSLQSPNSLTLLIDEKRIEQLFLNLLNNSIAYTDTPGKIQITMDQTDEFFILEICDSSPTVTSEKCNLLFNPLHREDTVRTRKNEGAGLGLAICKNIIEAHRGNIQATPSSLGGLCIHIKIPRGR